MIEGVQRGPFVLEELAGAGVTPDTYVWCKGMDSWRKAEEIGEICRYFRQRLSGMHVPVTSEGNVERPISGSDNVDGDFPRHMRRFVEESGSGISKIEDSGADDDIRPRPMILEAILVTVCCFPITGIIALYFAWQTASCWKEGRKAKSRECSRKAKMWIGITFFLGLIAVAFGMMKAGMGNL